MIPGVQVMRAAPFNLPPSAAFPKAIGLPPRPLGVVPHFADAIARAIILVAVSRERTDVRRGVGVAVIVQWPIPVQLVYAPITGRGVFGAAAGSMPAVRAHGRRVTVSAARATIGARAPRGVPAALSPEPRIVIAYCPRCRWLLRAAWLAQELLSTFEDELGEVALAPAGRGVFEVRTGDGTLLWSRVGAGRFPEAKELKQRVRDALFPDRDLGHADR